MKKLLSVVLVLAMILGSFSMVFASNYSDVTDTDAYAPEVAVLSSLGVIAGYPDGTFKPEKTVTRAEMAAMIIAALNLKPGQSSTTNFSDVPASHWASGVIAYANSMGIIAGYTDGTFKPEKVVSYDEAVAMVVAALGYTATSLNGTYPACFISKATALGILDDVKTTGTAGANRGDIAEMLYDALWAQIGHVNDENTWVASAGQGENDRDYMYARLGVEAVGAKVIVGTEDSVINLKPYIGIYAKSFKNDDGDIIAIGEIKGDLISADADIDGTTYKIGDYKIKDGAYDDLSATTTGAIARDKVLGYKFENGAATAITAAQMKTEVEAACASDSAITVAAKVSGNYITKIYSIAKWTVSDACVVDEDILDDIADKKIGTNKFIQTNKDEIDTDEFALFGAASLDDIKEDDVLYVYANGDKIVRIEVGTETVTGVVAKVSSATTPEYTIGGTKYKMSTAPGHDAAPSVKDEINAKLGYDGKIYDYELVKGDDSYAIVLNTSNNSDKYGVNEPVVKLFLADGTVAEYAVDTDEYDSVASMEAVGVTAGALVAYKISKNEITEFNATSESAVSGAKINTKGIYEGAELTDATVVFTFDALKAKTDKAAYGVTKMASVLDSTPSGRYQYVLKDGAFKAVVFSGVSTSEDIAAVIYDYNAVADDDYGYEIIALYDGAVKTFKADKTYAGFRTTTPGATMYKLTLNADGAVDSNPTNYSFSDAVTINVATKYESGKVTVQVADTTNSIDKNAKFALADDVTVYVYDASEDEWTVGSAKSLTVKADDIDTIKLFDADSTPDGIYDYALVFVK